MHNGFLQVEGKKMSKSEGNFITIHELLDDARSSAAANGRAKCCASRMLMTHYREPIDFTVARLEEAEEKLRGWQRAAVSAPTAAPSTMSVVEALADDLSFHRATVAIDAIARRANRGRDGRSR